MIPVAQALRNDICLVDRVIHQCLARQEWKSATGYMRCLNLGVLRARAVCLRASQKLLRRI